MPDYNKVILIGRLTRDPTLAYTTDQRPVAEFDLAVNRKWTDHRGQQREDVCFIKCVAYRNQAVTIDRYLSKGSCCLVEGSLQYQTWQGKDGPRSRQVVIAQSVQFLPTEHETDRV